MATQRRFPFRAAVAALLAVVLLNRAEAQIPPVQAKQSRIDPKADQVLRQMADFCKSLKSATVEITTECQGEFGEDGRAFMSKVMTWSVAFQQPNRYASRLTKGNPPPLTRYDQPWFGISPEGKAAWIDRLRHDHNDPAPDDRTIRHWVGRWLDNQKARAQAREIAPDRYSFLTYTLNYFKDFAGPENDIGNRPAGHQERDRSAVRNFKRLAGSCSAVRSPGKLRTIFKPFLDALAM